MQYQPVYYTGSDLHYLQKYTEKEIEKEKIALFGIELTTPGLIVPCSTAELVVLPNIVLPVKNLKCRKS